MAADELDGAGGRGRVQAVVVGHDLLSLGVGEHLVAAQAVAVGEAERLAALAAHGVQAVVRGVVLDLERKEGRVRFYGFVGVIFLIYFSPSRHLFV